MIVDRKHIGYAKLISPKEIVVGETCTLVIEFHVGSYGIDDGGNIRIAWRRVSDWESPQFTDPVGYGYTTVWTDGAAKVTLFQEPYERPFSNSLRINISDGYLKEGDLIRITIGDTSQGGKGSRAQSYCESAHEIRVFSDPFGTYRFFECEERLKMSIVSGEPHEIQAVIPASVNPGKDFDIVVRCLDKFGNPCSTFKGDIELSIPELDGLEYCITRRVSMRSSDCGKVRLSGNKVWTKGPFHVKAVCAAWDFKTYSNACFCQDPTQLDLYFGDMHGQNDLTIGTGSLDEYFSFARDVSAVDFVGWQGNDLEIDLEKWQAVREKTQEYNDEGRYVVFLGYEWSGNTPTGGDHNVYFLGDSEDYYPSSNALTLDRSIKPENSANPLPVLLEKFHGRDDVMLVPHIGGRRADLSFYDPRYMHNIEIHSHHGIFEWFAFDAMKRRLKAGFVAASDDHTCRLGMSYPLYKHGKKAHTAFDVASGLTGVYASALTKQAIWDGLCARRCYASTLGRVALLVKAGEYYMGEEISVDEIPELYIRVAGSAPIEKVIIYDWEEKIAEKRLLPVSKHRIRINWSGVVRRARKKSADWSGMLRIENGSLLSAKAVCFDRIDQGIISQDTSKVVWRSSTSGDIDGLELDLQFDERTILSFDTQYASFTILVSKITENAIEFDGGGENLKVEVSLASEVPCDEIEYLRSCVAELKEDLKPLKVEKENAIWVKVVQIDGQMAWSSPIFIDKNDGK